MEEAIFLQHFQYERQVRFFTVMGVNIHMDENSDYWTCMAISSHH